jgi:hypothetical protein
MSASATKVLDEVSSLANFAREGFKYNLQVLPDVIKASSLLFAILFQSPPMAIFSVATMLIGVIHAGIAKGFASVFPNMQGTPGNVGACAGTFPGVSYGRLFGSADSSTFGKLSDNAWPSYYTTFFGFLTGWIASLPTIYSAEIAASPKRATAVTGGFVMLGILLLVVVVYRITSNCDTFVSTSAGLITGFLVGVVMVLTVAYFTDRRGTNMLGLPLIRSRAEDGKPIYVCEKPVPPTAPAPDANA